MTIALEVAGALAEAATETAGSPLVATLIKSGENLGTARTPIYGAEMRHEGYCVVGSWMVSELQRSNVETTDTKLLLQALDVTPEPADRIEVQGVVYEIADLWALKPGGEVLMWTVAARR